MLPIKSCFRSIQICTLAAALGLSSTIKTTLSQPVSNQQNIQETQIIFNDPTPPSQGSPSGRQRGGASRGPCREFETLTALVPAQNGGISGRTTSDRPTFWFYLPKQLTEKTPVEFVVYDSANNYIYRTNFTAAGTRSGLINLTIPDTVKSLEVGKTYSWMFSIYCDPASPSKAVFVEGTIQRINPDSTLQIRLQAATSIEQVSLYAANGIWFEALNILAKLYQTNSGQRSIANAWVSLLQQAKLESLTQIPFTPCCTPEQKISN
ncbi:hypothetical protein NIES2119_21930 [[Phormidium ambiguum] IAM M-71]|uniref:DUF928 domain-containing protein n=1 Tax=[Phormidium ambiguum] IAM M-71 TaxID=454136 RepID=A0A1U7IBL2_9CYAN|nr:DUF928 domain-containing protein [Phormidium ambiguum]OKH33952.1 hypothetical protein NIES2119_21930 [Phormidium ambiguum IAM M-71]